jgi:anti-anti-sigma regulatory factor
VGAAFTAVAARDPVIIVDLAGLEFIDSSGAAALARGQRRARRPGSDLALAAPQRKVMRVLTIIRLNEGFSVYATVEEAAGERERSADVIHSSTGVPEQSSPQRTAPAGGQRPSSPGRALPGRIMRARPGDRVLVKERRAGEGDREAVIIEVWSEHGRPPYVVRWHDGSRKVFFPASADTLIAAVSVAEHDHALRVPPRLNGATSDSRATFDRRQDQDGHG